MRITYLGHSCFRIKGRDAEVVTDPFTGIGLPEPEAKADLVLCSHGHRDHSYVGRTAKKDAKVLVGFIGETAYAGVKVKGILTFHDDEKGEKRGRNSVYVFELDGITLCHLGDLGHELSSEECQAIGKVGVLFVPVGGFFTIGPEVADRVCEKISPKISIPMHFRTPKHTANFDRLSTVEDFTRLRDNVERVGTPDLELEAGKLPEEPVTVILEF